MSKPTDLLIELNDQQREWLDRIVATGLYGKTREDAVQRLLDAALIRFAEMPIDETI